MPATRTVGGAAAKHAVVLFDGVCNLCSGSVNFIIDHDPAGYFRFASLQSTTARELIAVHGLHLENLSTIILIEGGRAFDQSAAVLRIARRLRFPFNLAWIVVVIPEPLRDGIYGWIARHRYRWFGKTDACRLPTPERLGRFLPNSDAPA